jgi:hypothetical protein
MAESWWVISGSELMAALHRVFAGEDPDIAYAELYANSNVEWAKDCEEFGCHEQETDNP